ncbi:DUF4174 domain-containing protein [Profundibacterium mesophilum]|uniref:DUF4174 domain-containing protein n=1 Tax=Profundibacterium mesophilum KAUST100406-0324 TaxID=1037889 RepID=A0A921NXP6_9RHOB|nr:DUF4174 domain-containing protein [Profundibacterium mesophilum]KAF0675428.1 hypothetical protein PMES_02318 [Profundibacterium mesophilum KAUST100406-0324]
MLMIRILALGAALTVAALPSGAQQAMPSADGQEGRAAAGDAPQVGKAPSAADPATGTPVLLAPVDRWREDPKVALEAVDVSLEAFRWIARPVVVFADSPADPAFARQLDLLAARADDLALRDVVVITDTDPAAMSPLRAKLRPRGFMLALIGKDGGVKLRKPFPWDVRELTRSIDKMPLRRQELRERQNANQ